MSDKHARLLDLARLRQQIKWPRDKGYRCIGDYHCGLYECDFVSPYTRGACNGDSELMLLLQDWASDEVLSGPFLRDRCTVGHDPRRGTNKRLKELLRRHFKLELKDTFATNVFPFVKLGSMNKSIPRSDLECAAKDFALPQIRVVEPRLAVCLGKAAFNAVAVAAGRGRADSLADAIASPFEYRKTLVWCQAHTSQQGTNSRNRNAVDQVERDWERMAAEYRRRIKRAGA